MFRRGDRKFLALRGGIKVITGKVDKEKMEPSKRNRTRGEEKRVMQPASIHKSLCVCNIRKGRVASCKLVC